MGVVMCYIMLRCVTLCCVALCCVVSVSVSVCLCGFGSPTVTQHKTAVFNRIVKETH